MKKHVDYSDCGPARKPVVKREGPYRYSSREARGTPWTPGDEAILRKLFGNTPAEDIAKRIGRKVASVNHRASRLGLKK